MRDPATSGLATTLRQNLNWPSRFHDTSSVWGCCTRAARACFYGVFSCLLLCIDGSRAIARERRPRDGLGTFAPEQPAERATARALHNLRGLWDEPAPCAADRGEHQRRPDQCTRQHRRRPYCPCLRHLLPQRRAQHHQERSPPGGGGRLGHPERTSELLESAPCAEHQPGLVGLRATDRAPHHRRLHRRFRRRCLCLFRHGHDHVFMDHREHSHLGDGTLFKLLWRGRRCFR